MRLLITGAGGQLGRALAAAATASGHDVTAFGHTDLDVAGPGVAEAVARVAPDVVLNAAAYTDVDGAARDTALAFAVNETGVRNLARAARLAGARLVTYSTDYVFDGGAGRPYTEGDGPAPVQAYGRSKLAGEIAATEEHPHGTWIVRTCWVFSAGGRNFVPTILRLARERAAIDVVADQIGSPTYAPDLAAASLDLITQTATGLVHLVGGGSPASRLDLATTVVGAAGLEVELRPVSAASFGSPAARPANSSLATARQDVPALPDWRDAVLRCARAFTQESSS
jgi:dTDP-4-dehydrorhamnose reductase